MQAAPSMKKAQLAIVKQRKSFPFLSYAFPRLALDCISFKPAIIQALARAQTNSKCHISINVDQITIQC